MAGNVLHVKFQSFRLPGSQVIGKVKVYVKVFVTDGRTDRRNTYFIPITQGCIKTAILETWGSDTEGNHLCTYHTVIWSMSQKWTTRLFLLFANVTGYLHKMLVCVF